MPIIVRNQAGLEGFQPVSGDFLEIFCFNSEAMAAVAFKFWQGLKAMPVEVVVFPCLPAGRRNPKSAMSFLRR